MELYLFTWTLLSVLGIDGAATQICPAAGGTRFNLSVASRRNLTGHWIVTVNGVREDPQQISATNATPGVAIDVGHHTSSCEGTGMVQLTATAVLDAVATIHEDTAPPDGYEMLNGIGYFKMHTNPLKWEEAKNKCVEEGARLLIINSDEEAAVIKAIYNRDRSKIPSTNDRSGAWVGFNDFDSEKNYITALGKPPSSSGYVRLYSEDQHNNRKYKCCFITTDALQSTYTCDAKLAFFCEFRD